MTDIHSSEIRSFNMSRIRSKNTTPERIIRAFLFSHGFRYRIHYKKLPGKPDIVLPKYKTVIFVNGCFWHGHENCRYFSIPKTRSEYWSGKIEKNKSKDRDAVFKIRDSGWDVIVIWECELKRLRAEETLNRIFDSLKLKVLGQPASSK
ncbi:very short patch repair endonuclease [Mucilaginibacter sp. L3T2-6]|nr:DNA mismatch endonuclease Vsr [Mucilaginibacter sp. L3T2-6]MDO3641217.1 DNA mismatch endonuclease Vsr [Mucilaginibacter sp. L3T2-6]